MWTIFLSKNKLTESPLVLNIKKLWSQVPATVNKFNEIHSDNYSEFDSESSAINLNSNWEESKLSDKDLDNTSII